MSCTNEKVEFELTVPWGQISAVAWGKPQDKPVLVVHGTMDNAGSFTRLIQHLPENYYYVVIDLPCHGKSSHYPQGMNLDFLNFVLSIRHVLDQLKWRKCFYLGHSFGAQLGIMFSIINPGRLERIIAIDALMPRTMKNDELVDRIRFVQESTVFAMNRNESTLYTKEEIFYALLNRRDFKLNYQAAEALFDRATTKINNMYKLNRDPRMRAIVVPLFNHQQLIDIIKNLKVPILLIVPEETWFNHQQEYEKLNKIQTILGNNLLDTIHVEGNHDVHNNNPEIVAPHVTKFFNDAKSKL